MAYWLFKSEPNCYSFADLMAAPDQTTGWDGVRNFQARNHLRDAVRDGDGVLCSHSSADHYDTTSDPKEPTWYQVSIRAVRPIEPPLGLPLLRTVPALARMELLRK